MAAEHQTRSPFLVRGARKGEKQMFSSFLPDAFVVSLHLLPARPHPARGRHHVLQTKEPQNKRKTVKTKENRREKRGRSGKGTDMNLFRHHLRVGRQAVEERRRGLPADFFVGDGRKMPRNALSLLDGHEVRH
jgi:hypothetical protein